MPEPRTLRSPRRPASVLGWVALLGLGASIPGGAARVADRGPAAEVLGERLTAPGSGDSGNGKNNGAGNDGKNFTVAGSVVGLYPGATRPLVLTVANQNNFPIRVAALVVSVGNVSGCPGSHLDVSAYPAGSVVVPANAATTTTLSVRMDDDAPNACKGRTFGLTYSGTAAKA